MRWPFLVAASLLLLPATALAQVAHISVRGDHPDLALYARDDRTFVPLCQPPCEVDVLAGVQEFGLGVQPNVIQSAGEVRLTPGRHVLAGHYGSRKTVRAALLVAFVSLDIIGANALLVDRVENWSTPDVGLLSVGFTCALIGLVAFFIAIGLNDDVSVRVDPPS